MDRQGWTRRAILMGWAAGGIVSALSGRARAAPTPEAMAGLRFRAVVVDTSRLAALGNPTTAELIGQELGGQARQIFADRLAPGDPRAPTLVIRIDSISLSSYAGDRYRGRGGSANTDYLEGAGLVSAGGRVISATPILSALDANYSGAWYLPDIDQRRIASISHHFAYWLRREMGI